MHVERQRDGELFFKIDKGLVQNLVEQLVITAPHRVQLPVMDVHHVLGPLGALPERDCAADTDRGRCQFMMPV